MAAISSMTPGTYNSLSFSSVGNAKAAAEKISADFPKMVVKTNQDPAVPKVFVPSNALSSSYIQKLTDTFEGKTVDFKA